MDFVSIPAPPPTVTAAGIFAAAIVLKADAGATVCKDVAAACNAIVATLHGTATAAVAAVTAAEAIVVDYVSLMLPSLYFLGWLLLLRLHLHYLLGQELGLLMSARLPHLNIGFFLRLCVS
jgi:hypothetical protein